MDIVIDEKISGAPTSLATSSRISWAAVAAGATTSLAAHILFSLLGLGIGAAVISPETQEHPLSGMGMGSLIWTTVTTLVALMLGGMVAGRLAGVVAQVDAALTGIVTWAIVTVLSISVLGSAAGGVISRAGALLVQGATVSVQGIVSSGQSALNSANVSGENIQWEPIKDEIYKTLLQTRDPSLDPKELSKQIAASKDDAKSSVERMARDPVSSPEELTQLIHRMFGTGSAMVQSVDREALINVIQARTNMTRADSGAAVTRWEEASQALRAKYEQAKEDSVKKARQVGEAAAHAVSQFALWSFLALAIGAAASAFGGWMGAQKRKSARLT